MQQISSKQLKCYGRRNRAKPEPSGLGPGSPVVRDVSGATDLEEPLPSATSVQDVEVVVAQVKKPHAGRGRPRKVVGAPKQGEKAPGDVVVKSVPATRSSAGRHVAPEAREVARDPVAVQESVSEGSALKAPVQPQERTPIRVRIVGPFSNGGSKHGRKKSLGFPSPGSQKTRGQIARQEAQRAADDETSEGLQLERGQDEGQVGRAWSGEGRPLFESEIEGNSTRRKEGAGEQVIEKRDERQSVTERKTVGGKSHCERRDAAEQVVENMGEEQSVAEKTVGGVPHRGRKDAGEQVAGKRDEGQFVTERKVGVKSHREKKDGGHSGRDKEEAATQGTLASRRRLLALQKRQLEDLMLSQADDVLLKQEYLEANKDKKGQPRSKEPIRPKTHWDFVIEEMTWLAKDFEREQKWKLSQAKKVALRVNRSKLDVVARENRRLKDEDQRMRRVASNIAKDVKKFWLKVDKLVSYKQQLLVEERKKKALDKHLDFLLGQTERYSTMLAENLADTTTAYGPQSTLLLRAVPKDGSGADGQMLPVASEQLAIADEAENLEGAVSMEIEGGDDDFMVEDEEEQEDDEATLEADEALITEDERKEELSALQRESELPLEDLVNAYKLMRGDSASEAEAEDEDEDEDEDDSGEAEEGDGAVREQVTEDATAVVSGEVTLTEEPQKSPVFTPRGAAGTSPDERAVGQPESVEGFLGFKDDGDVDEIVMVALSPGRKEELPGEGIVDASTATREKTMAGPVVGVGLPRLFSKGGAIEAAGNSTNLVVELTHQNAASRLVNDEIRRHPSPKCLDQQIAELQDDKDYIPAVLADGNDEDDDERTLEEEERIAKEEGGRNVNEIDELKLESEMPLEELLAKYRAAINVDGEDSDDFSVDRRDRTSEAGTSGSGSDEEEDDEDAHYFSDARERMGEPSTSGRGYEPLISVDMEGEMASSQVMNRVEVKQEIVEAKMVSSNVGDFQKMDVHGMAVYSEALKLGRNGLSGAGFRKDILSSTLLLLGGGDEVDAETAAAVAKVSEAARRRGDRIMTRSSTESRGTQVGNESEEKAVLKVGGSEENAAPDETLGLPAIAVTADDYAGCGSGRPALDTDRNDIGAVASADVSKNLGNGVVQTCDDVIGGKPGDAVDVVPLVSAGEDRSAEIQVQVGADPESVEVGEDKNSEDRLADFAAAAQSAQPTGYTFSTTKVKTKLPFLLKHSLREYQHIGLDWLVTMYEKRLNGILADEMGLGKTIMTIALLAHLACEKGIWGPHLIVVPTSVMLNWETEFMKWCPAFKILTYFGSAKERKVKRQGWSRPNSFHVCITTYRLVIQDAKAFKRKKWKYLILDEAHLIKNWKSQRWQTLLNFNSKRRILLTGTPLQNDLMELWSLMHFLMPHVFQSHQEFRDWFCNPITGMVEGEDQVNKELVDRLHNVLRPFLLRRLKKDVEKQLPGKFEHVIRCRLSKRQRNLYEDFMASSDTQATLSSGNFLGLINVLMQLRKVCNHPDLFEGRPIISSFDMPGMEVHLSSAACSAMSVGPLEGMDLETLNLRFSGLNGRMSKWEAEEVAKIKTPGPLIVELASSGEDSWKQQQSKHKPSKEVRSVMEEIHSVLRGERERRRKETVVALWMLNEFRCNRQPLYGADFLKMVEVMHPVYDVHKVKGNPRQYLEFSNILSDMVQLPPTRCDNMMDLVTAFMFAIPAARAPLPVAWCSHAGGGGTVLRRSISEDVVREASSMLVPLRPAVVRRQLFFPDRRLLQFDCGKLQELAVLLRRLKSEGHRALIFTQMTKMLDVLESFINLYGYTYMRLDGSTKPEQRQILMQRFNTNPKIFLFILSTRSGGVGINLVGADTVIFYDSDWNPAMDLQAQDRCHRIGQTREVHIYRLISESTIEENILKKANQKRILDDLVIQSGSYNTEFFKKLDPMELFSGLKGVKVGGPSEGSCGENGGASVVASEMPDASSRKVLEQKELSNAEVEAALRNAEDEADYMAMKRVEQEEAAENQEFTEELFAGNLDDEDLADDLEENGRSGKPQSDVAVAGGPAVGERGPEDGGSAVATEGIPFEESSILPTDADEEMDMLADVRQMAAAAAASGRGSVSFEDQLRPVERYAMRFLEVWDPRVDNLAVVAQVAFEEKEWELDQLEKLKEEQEAEIDEDNEPLFYETWDTALADEAYRQQVDILAQQQEQKQLEWEAMEEEMRDADRALAEAAATVRGAENFTLKLKGKKKMKKAKFKSLAEGSLMSDTEENYMGDDYQVERGGDPSYRDVHSDMVSLPHRSPSQRKRKATKLLEEDVSVETNPKKSKKDYFLKGAGGAGDKGKGKQRTLEDNIFRTIFGISSDHKLSGGGRQESGGVAGGVSGSGGHGGAASSGKNKGGKLTISGMPSKKGPLVMLEKERKKDSSRSQDHLPPASPWTHGEDAVLCAVVHEYGGNWQLASDALAGGPDGGVYRGRHRHPVHCRERFRQLLAQNAAAASGDPSSEKSAVSAATNAQLKVTEEHTKRLLDAVLQLPDQELLVQRHFVAVLAALKNWKKVGVQHGGEKEPAFGGSNPPCGRSFVALKSLVRSDGALSKVGGGRLSPREVSAALAQAESETKAASNQGSSKAQGKGQVAEIAGLKAGNEGFSVAQFLVGSVEYGESRVTEGESVVHAQSAAVTASLEDLLGYALPSCPPRATSKGVRHVAEMLVENRFRFATKIGWDGATRDWAAAGGSGTGVLGLHIPSKGKGVGKKRPAPDPSKPPKAKLAKISKSGTKKGLADPAGDERSPVSAANGEDLHVLGDEDGEANGEEAVGGAPLRRSPLSVQKSSTKRPKKKATNPVLSTSPRGSGELDLNIQEPDSVVLDADAKVGKSGRKGGPGVGTTGGPKAAQKTEKKSSKTRASPAGQGRNSEAGCRPRIGPGKSGSSSRIGRDSNGGGSGNDRLGAGGIDLSESSDDEEVTIVGVLPGKRSFGLFDSPGAAPGRRSESSGHLGVMGEILGTPRSKLAERGEPAEPSFPASRSSGMGYGALDNDDSSLASHPMGRLAGSCGEDLGSVGVLEGLSQVEWPPASGGWPGGSLNDLDLSANLPSVSFSEGKQKAAVASPLRSSPPRQEGGRSHEWGSATPTVPRLQASDGARRTGSVQEEPGQTPAWMVARQHGVGGKRESQGAGGHASSNSSRGGSDRSGQLLRLGGSSPVARPAMGSGSHPSPSRGSKSSSQMRAPSWSPQMRQPGAFPGARGQSFSSPESLVDTGLELSLGSRAVQKQSGVGTQQDVELHSPPP